MDLAEVFTKAEELSALATECADAIAALEPAIRALVDAAAAYDQTLTDVGLIDEGSRPSDIVSALVKLQCESAKCLKGEGELALVKSVYEPGTIITEGLTDVTT